MTVSLEAGPQLVRASWLRATLAGWPLVAPPGVPPLEAWAPMGPGSAEGVLVERDTFGVTLRCHGVQLYVANQDVVSLQVSVRRRA